MFSTSRYFIKDASGITDARRPTHTYLTPYKLEDLLLVGLRTLVPASEQAKTKQELVNFLPGYVAQSPKTLGDNVVAKVISASITENQKIEVLETLFEKDLGSDNFIPFLGKEDLNLPVRIQLLLKIIFPKESVTRAKAPSENAQKATVLASKIRSAQTQIDQLVTSGSIGELKFSQTPILLNESFGYLSTLSHVVGVATPNKVPISGYKSAFFRSFPLLVTNSMLTVQALFNDAIIEIQGKGNLTDGTCTMLDNQHQQDTRIHKLVQNVHAILESLVILVEFVIHEEKLPISTFKPSVEQGKARFGPCWKNLQTFVSSPPKMSGFGRKTNQSNRKLNQNQNGLSTNSTISSNQNVKTKN